MTECYYPLDDDYYNSVHCDLTEGHDGPHRASYEWETRPADICSEIGHDWSDWVPAEPKRWAYWEAPSLHVGDMQRECRRCQRLEGNNQHAQDRVVHRG